MRFFVFILTIFACLHSAYADVSVSVSSPSPEATVSRNFKVVGTTVPGSYVKVSLVLHRADKRAWPTLYFANPADNKGNFHVSVDYPQVPPDTIVEVIVTAVDPKGEGSAPITVSLKAAAR